MAQLGETVKKIAKQGDFAATAKKGVLELTEAVMQSEAKRLADCINRQIDAYYASYSPEVYDRSDALREAAEARPGVSVSTNGTVLHAVVSIKDVPGHSVFGGSSYDQARLIDEGWAVRSDAPHARIPHFGFQGGFDFVQKGVNDFLASNPYNLSVSVGAE